MAKVSFLIVPSIDDGRYGKARCPVTGAAGGVLIALSFLSLDVLFSLTAPLRFSLR